LVPRITRRESRALVVALLWTGIACAEPTVQFFSPVEGVHRLGRMVTDTVLVFRIGPSDSVAHDGVDLAFDLLDRAHAARHSEIAGRIEGVLAQLPAGARVRKSKPGRRESDLVAGLAAQNLLNHVVLLRADYLVVSDVMPDTVARAVEAAATEADPSTEQWLSLIVTGQTAIADTL
jgi:hypothetical protein